MSEQLELRIKTEVEGAEKVENINQTLDESTKKSKESADGFSLQNTRAGQFFNGIAKGAKMGVTSMMTLKGAVAATGIGLLLIAIVGIVNWFKKTETGADLLQKGMKMLGQVIKEGPMLIFNALKVAIDGIVLAFNTVKNVITNVAGVLTGQKSIKQAVSDVKTSFHEDSKKIVEDANKLADGVKKAVSNVIDSGKLADAWDALEDKRRDNLEKNKKLEAEIADAREKASDTDEKMIDRINAANTALEKQTELYKIQKADKAQEIANINEELRLYPDNQEWIEKLATAKAELFDIDRQYSNDKKRLNKTVNSLEKEQTQTAQKEADERKKIAEEEVKRLQEIAEKGAKSLEDVDNQLTLQKLKGQEKELKQLEINYQKDYDAFVGTEEQKLEYVGKINDLYLEQRKEIEDRYRAEKEKADKDAADRKKADDDKANEELNKALTNAAMNTASNIANSVLSIQQNKLDAQKEAESSSLEAQKERELSNKNLTEAQKDAINAKYKAKNEKLNKEYAEKQRKQDIKTAIVAGSLAILNALATTKPFFPLGLIAAASAAVTTGIQIATIKNTKYASGGWINGKKHANGGTVIEAEQGEYVVNAKTMANPQMAQQVQQLNNAGNNNTSAPSALDENKIAAIVAKSIKAVPVSLNLAETTRTQKKVEVTESNFSVK